MLVPVIVSGGAGTRLWPVSRQLAPKPFIKLPDGDSIISKVFNRVLSLCDVSSVLTVTNREYFFRTKDEFYLCDNKRNIELDFVLEPIGRNTAPAIASAAKRLVDRGFPDAVMLVLPADHLISDVGNFEMTVAEAVEHAKDGRLVTFGIKPSYPETGFGYIKCGSPLNGKNGEKNVYDVVRFIEKPDNETAKRYLDSGGFLWNSGMFCFTAAVFLQELENNAPDVLSKIDDCWNKSDVEHFPVELDLESFAVVPNISIDYAVMEKTSNVVVVESDFDWNDIGSWTALADTFDQDDNQNNIDGDFIGVDTNNCIVSSGDALIATVGINDLIIASTSDVVMVAAKDRSQDVKKLYEILKQQDRSEYMQHRTVFRPWGDYTTIGEGNGFKVKRIEVSPGERISLQSHNKRSEHWVVVSGEAQVINDDKIFSLKPNESTYIEIGSVHRLENTGEQRLVLIEVQCGEYLGEDDIVRIDDSYGR